MKFRIPSAARELREECREKQKRFGVGYGDHKFLAGDPPSIDAVLFVLDQRSGLRLASQCCHTNPGQIGYSTPFYYGQHTRRLCEGRAETQYDDADQQSEGCEAREDVDESPRTHRAAEKAAPAVDVLTPDFMGQTGRPAVVREGTG